MTTAPWDLPPHSWGQRLEENETASCEAPCRPRAPQTATDARCQLSEEHKILEGRDRWMCPAPQSTSDERRVFPMRQRRNRGPGRPRPYPGPHNQVEVEAGTRTQSPSSLAQAGTGQDWIPPRAPPPAVHICRPPWDEAIAQEPGQGCKHPGQNNRRRFQGVGSAAQGQALVPTELPPPAWLWELHS